MINHSKLVWFDWLFALLNTTSHATYSWWGVISLEFIKNIGTNDSKMHSAFWQLSSAQSTSSTDGLDLENLNTICWLFVCSFNSLRFAAPADHYKTLSISSDSTLCSSCSVVKLYSFSRRMTGRMSRLGPRINHNLDLCSSQPTNLILSEGNYLCLFLSRLQLLTCQIWHSLCFQ